MAIILLFNYLIGTWHTYSLSEKIPIENIEATRKVNADSFILWSLNLSHQQFTIIALTNDWFLFSEPCPFDMSGTNTTFNPVKSSSLDAIFRPCTEGTLAESWHFTSRKTEQRLWSLGTLVPRDSLPCHWVVRSCPLLTFELPTSPDQHRPK